jgi:cation transport ATPase
VLVKSAVVMEDAGAAGVVAFDKTGTLTEGTPRLAEVRVLEGAGRDEREILILAAAAENPSEHPLARAVVAAARDAGLAVPAAAEFTSLPGRGVSAVVNGQRVEIGRPRHLPGVPGVPGAAGATAAGSGVTGPVAALAAGAVADLEADGQTAVVMRIDGDPVAVLGVADRIRPAAAAAVTRITALTGTSPVLLTGDNERAARKLAGQAGITDVRAGLLPEDKVTAVRELEAAGRKVLLAGDGVNDAPALAAASTGAAMGRAGSDLALDAADLVIMRDDLAAIPAVIALSRRARRVVTANLWIAAVIIAGLVSWDLAGHLPLPLGVLGHEGSTVIVGLNGLRLLRASTWPAARP